MVEDESVKVPSKTGQDLDEVLEHLEEADGGEESTGMLRQELYRDRLQEARHYRTSSSIRSRV